MSFRYRDQARARLASEPPDAGFDGAGRRRWRERVSRLARLLDALEAEGRDDSALGPLLLLGFRALLPLADPGWWRAHPRARLNAEARRQLRRIDKRRRREARHGRAQTALGRLELQASSAAAIYARHGDVAALGLCARFFDALDQALAGAGGIGPPVIGHECRTHRPAGRLTPSPVDGRHPAALPRSPAPGAGLPGRCSMISQMVLKLGRRCARLARFARGVGRQVAADGSEPFRVPGGRQLVDDPTAMARGFEAPMRQLGATLAELVDVEALEKQSRAKKAEAFKRLKGFAGRVERFYGALYEVTGNWRLADRLRKGGRGR